MREAEVLDKQVPPQGVFVCDHAGFVINQLSSSTGGRKACQPERRKTPLRAAAPPSARRAACVEGFQRLHGALRASVQHKPGNRTVRNGLQARLVPKIQSATLLQQKSCVAVLLFYWRVYCRRALGFSGFECSQRTGIPRLSHNSHPPRTPLGP